MNITNRVLLLEFVRKHRDTINAVNRWIELIESNDFANHAELKLLFPMADYVGNSRYVFNIKGGQYRFVVMVLFVNGIMEIRFCGTHAEYDKIKNIGKL